MRGLIPATVIAGLDPAIQQPRIDWVVGMDCRVKPGNDGGGTISSYAIACSQLRR